MWPLKKPGVTTMEPSVDHAIGARVRELGRLPHASDAPVLDEHRGVLDDAALPVEGEDVAGVVDLETLLCHEGPPPWECRVREVPESTPPPRGLSIARPPGAMVERVPLAHVALALLVTVIWGVAFVATRIALDDFSPPALTALRFLVAAVPALPLPGRRRVARARRAGLTLYTGQFLFQFFGIAAGMPPGLASVVVQTQALFTIVFSALILGERPSVRQWTGTAVAFAGLAFIAATVGRDLTAIGFWLTALAAVSWGVGNVLVKRLPAVDPLALVVWLSLVPPVPSLVLSVCLDGPRALGRRSPRRRGSRSGRSSTWAWSPPCSPTRSGDVSSAAIPRPA